MKKAICEICGEFGFVDSHHIHSKAFNGSNRPWNIINTCPNCHRAIHAGEICVKGKYVSTDGPLVITDTKPSENCWTLTN